MVSSRMVLASSRMAEVFMERIINASTVYASAVAVALPIEHKGGYREGSAARAGRRHAAAGGRAGCGRAGRTAHVRGARLARADVVRSRRDAGRHHPVPDALCPP